MNESDQEAIDRHERHTVIAARVWDEQVKELRATIERMEFVLEADGVRVCSRCGGIKGQQYSPISPAGQAHSVDCEIGRAARGDPPPPETYGADRPEGE